MEWNIVFYISTVIALIPVLIFSLWGSADVQYWARSASVSCPTLSTVASMGTLAAGAAGITSTGSAQVCISCGAPNIQEKDPRDIVIAEENPESDIRHRNGHTVY